MAVDMFLKLDGIDGEAQDRTHRHEIDVLAWSWGASQSGTLHIGAGGGAGKVNFQDVSITKYVDRASALLLQHVADGKHIPEGVLTVRKAEENALEYIIIRFFPVMVTSVSTGGSGGEDRLTENITLNFGAFNYKYTPQNEDGSSEREMVFGWDIQANEAVPPIQFFNTN